MIQITIPGTEREKIYRFADFIKKINAANAYDEKTTFVLNLTPGEKTLELFSLGKSGSGGRGLLYSKLNVTSNTEDRFVFRIDVSVLVNGLSKIHDPDVVFTINQESENSWENRLVLTNASSKKSSIKFSLLRTPLDDEVEEMVALGPNSPNGPYQFIDDTITVIPDITVFDTFIGLTNVTNMADSFSLAKNQIKFADNLCIMDLQTNNDLLATEDDTPIIINRNLAALSKMFKSLKVSKEFIFFDTSDITGYYAPKMPKFQFPTDEEIESILPSKSISFTVKGADLFTVLSQYSGIFQTANRKYDQIKLVVASNQSEFKTYFDDQTAEVEEYLPITNFNDEIGITDTFELQLPCIYLKKLESLFKDEDITFKVNNIDPSTDDHETAIELITSNTRLVLAKLV